MQRIDYGDKKRANDSTNQYDVLRSLPEQIRVGVEAGQSADTSGIDPDSFTNMLVCGMGGSAIGGEVLKTLANRRATIPVAVNRHYRIPNYVSERSLVVVMSYSGGTEESLTAYRNARERNSSIIAITSGGDLGDRAARDGVPVVLIPGGKAPRAAFGYLLFSLLAVSAKLNVLSIEKDEIDEAYDIVQQATHRYDDYSDPSNQAIQIAETLHGKLPVIYAVQDELESVAVRWRCQIEENAKMLSYTNVFPELNHNEIVGWEQNADLLKRIALVVLGDDDDEYRMAKRISLTVDMIRPYAGEILQVKGVENTMLQRILGLICLGDWVSFYLAIGTNIDPFPIKKIDALKSAMASS